MNAPVDSANAQVTAWSNGAPKQIADSQAAASAVLIAETPPGLGEPAADDNADDKICWIQVRESPYPPDQQVELLHLQAEAEALLLQLQAMHQRRLS